MRRRVDLGDVERPGERTGVGEQRHPAARERGPGEVAVEARDRLGELGVRGRDDGLRDRQPELADEALEGGLVVEAGERRERRREQGRRRRESLVAGREVEGLLERGHDHVDLGLGHDPLDLVDERLGLGPRRRVGEVAREVLGVAAGREPVVVGRVDLVAGARELAHHAERERHPRAGDQDLQRESRAGRPKSPNGSSRSRTACLKPASAARRAKA